MSRHVHNKEGIQFPASVCWSKQPCMMNCFLASIFCYLITLQELSIDTVGKAIEHMLGALFLP